MAKIEKNITKIYLIKTARWLMLTTPYLPLFLEANGVDKHSYGLLAAIHALSIIFLEIPSGYLADAIGRKKTLIIGALLGFLGFVIYSLSFSFSGFLLALITLGIGQSMISGSDSALLYETLAAMKKERDYAKYEGRVTALGNFMETTGAPLGGLLAAASLRYPFIAQAVVALIAVPAALTLVEPERDGEKGLRKGQSFNLLLSLKRSLVLDSKLLLLVFYSGLIGTGTYTMAKAIPYWHQETLQSSVAELGIFWSALNLSAALFATYAYRVERKVDRLSFMAGIGLVVSLSFICLAFASQYVAIALLFLFYCCRGLATPILKNYVNDQTESDVRATVLSVRMFLVYLLFAVIFPVMGWVGDRADWSSALALAGGFFSLICSAAILSLYAHERRRALNA